MPGAIAVAIVPSTQHSGFGRYVEGENMRQIGQLTVAELQRQGIAAQMFWSQDDSLDELAALYRQADSWVRRQPQPIRCVISLHSDSGLTNHCFGIWGRRDGISLALALAVTIGAVFPTDDVRVFDSLGDVQYGSYLFTTQTTAPSVLIECGSHQSAEGLAVLSSDTGRRAIAQACCDGLLQWARGDY